MSKGKTALKVSAATVAGSVGVAAAACALIAPRHRNARLRQRWEALSVYRYAHRGLHDNDSPAPENSLAAFRRARDLGYGSELDVHLSADGVPVVIHDSKLERACGVEGQVECLTVEQLQQLRLFGSEERIPLFADVLELYEAGEGTCPPLVVELKTAKNNYAELCEKAMALLDAHEVPYCVESFDPRVLLWLRRNRRDVIRGQLSEHFRRDEGSDLGFVRASLGAALVSNVVGRPDFVAYRFEHRHHPAVLLACGPLGAWRVYWTVGNRDDLHRADLSDAVSIFEGFSPEPMRA